MKVKMRVRRFREGLETKRLSTFTLVWSVLVLYFFTVLQTSLASYFKIGNASFDLIFPAALFLSIYTNEYYGAVYGVVMGSVFDMVNNSRIPVMPIIFLVICARVGSMFPADKKGNFIRKYVVFTSCLAIRYASTFLLELFRNATPLELLLTIILPGFLYTLLLSPIVMLICSPAGRDNSK